MGEKLAQHPLGELFRLSPEPVFGQMRCAVVFCNDRAQELFGFDITGESMERVLPGTWDCPAGSQLAATVGGRAVKISVAAFQGVTVYTLRSLAQSAPLPAGSLRQMRVSAANLRLGLDRLIDRTEKDPYVPVLYHSYHSLLHSVEQLSDLRALSEGELPLERKAVELGQLCLDITDSVSFLLGDTGTALRCTAPEAPCTVLGDRERLEQLTLILLSNALRHTPPDGMITVTVRAHRSRAYLTVEDNGTGMDSRALARAFDPITEDELTGGTGGGLGLHIAQGIARLHGGALLLESREGEGTKVSLSLPASEKLPLQDSAPVYAAGPSRILTELADILPGDAYWPEEQ